VLNKYAANDNGAVTIENTTKPTTTVEDNVNLDLTETTTETTTTTSVKIEVGSDGPLRKAQPVPYLLIQIVVLVRINQLPLQLVVQLM
jgi:hypothetical protein